MENEKPNEFGIKPEPLPQKATDMELTMFLMTHIDNPCGIEVAPGVRENIRQFYLREAGTLLEKFTNPSAKELLKEKIAQYHKDGKKNG